MLASSFEGNLPERCRSDGLVAILLEHIAARRPLLRRRWICKACRSDGLVAILKSECRSDGLVAIPTERWSN